MKTCTDTRTGNAHKDLNDLTLTNFKPEYGHIGKIILGSMEGNEKLILERFSLEKLRVFIDGYHTYCVTFKFFLYFHNI